MKDKRARDATPAKDTKLRDRIIFLALLAVVVALGVLLLIRTRELAPKPPPRAAKPVPREPGRDWGQLPSAWMPSSQPTSAPTSQPDQEPPPPLLPPPPKSNVPLELTPEGKWVPLRRTGGRNWTEFQSTPPYRFVSEEEQRRFREYWLKEANVRVNIYCDVTDVCPPAGEVARLLDSLFDDILPQREDETTDQYRSRVERWMDTRRRWWELFHDTPQSVFSFAGLEQFRGKPPEPPLQPDQVDAGPEIRRPDDPTKRPKDAGAPQQSP